MKFVEIAFHRCYTSVHFSIQPTCTPARDGQPSTRMVGRQVGGLKFSKLFRCADSFIWAKDISSSGQR